jgi:4'-phosphopantetheinyl transferase
VNQQRGGVRLHVTVDWSEPVDSPKVVDHLDDVEMVRWSKYQKSADRSRYATARWLLKRRIAEITGSRRVRIDFTCPHCGRSHGAPRLPANPDLHLSVSHSGNRVAVAVSTVPVGIDLEPMHPLENTAIETLVLSASEQSALASMSEGDRPLALLKTWVRKEALLKAAGIGLNYPMTMVTLADCGHGPEVVEWALDGHPWLTDLSLGTGYVCSLAAITDGTFYPTVSVERIHFR